MVLSVSDNDIIKNIAVFPNPSSGNSEIQFKIDNYSLTSIKLIDNLGNIKKILHNGYLNEGNYNFKISAEDLPPGVYLIAIQTNENIFTEKIIISR